MPPQDSAPGPLTIGKTYLRQLQNALGDLLNAVEDQLNGVGTVVVRGNTLNLPPVDGSLAQDFRPGASTLQGATFNVGAALADQLNKMGTSVNDVLTGLEQVLTSMMSEIDTTINQMGDTETLNTESVDQLISEFSATIQGLNSPPGTKPAGG